MQKTHPTYTRYNITVSGKVINNTTGKVLKPTLSSSGYYVVTLYDSALPAKQFTIHQLVVETFVGEVPEGMHIDHIDGNKLHNHLKNLEVVTPIVNTQRYHAKREFNYNNPKTKKGKNSRLSVDTVVEMIKDIREGMSNAEAGQKYGVHPRYVSLIRHKRRWGYAWHKMGLEGATTNPSGSRV